MHLLSMIIPCVVLLPNAAFFAAKPQGSPAEPIADTPELAAKLRLLTTMERVGQMGVFLLPLFYHLRLDATVHRAALGGMALALALYYAGWVRYFTGGRRYELLTAPMLGIPVPMAVAPVAYFLLSSVLLSSVWMAVAALVLAAGHIPITLMSRRR